MRRRGSFAASVFCILSLGGILALFSQQARHDGTARVRALDPKSSDPRSIEQVLPAAIETGLRALRSMTAGESADAESEPKAPSRLLLR